jgi:hypothetical protein
VSKKYGLTTLLPRIWNDDPSNFDTFDTGLGGDASLGESNAQADIDPNMDLIGIMGNLRAAKQKKASMHPAVSVFAV